MGVVLHRGYYYWVKRIPKRYKGLVLGANGQPIQQVRQALHTDSKVEAEAKAAQIEATKFLEWEALAAGYEDDARHHYDAARRLAEARGFPYRPLPDLASGDLTDLVTRILSLVQDGKLTAGKAEIEAVLGGVAPVQPKLSEVLVEYFDLTRTRHTNKSPAQLKRWSDRRTRSVKRFVEVVGDLPIDQITRAEALKFRAYCSGLVDDGKTIDYANKLIGVLSEVVRTWLELNGSDLANPFANLRLEGKDTGKVDGFSRSWVATRLLAPGALDSLNDEARDILLMMVNTGLRPSEIMGAPLSDFEVSAPIPFFRVAAHGRELKVAHTAREIPLLGVSLEAARRIHDRGGISRYPDKADSWSAAVNKHLRTNGLQETRRTTAYSLRHYIENALLAAGVDDRVRADILGHKYERPNYGDGGGLQGRHDALSKVAL